MAQAVKAGIVQADTAGGFLELLAGREMGRGSAFCGFEKYTSKKGPLPVIDRGPKNILIYLAFQDMQVYNMTTTNKGRAKGVSSTPRPYAGATPPTQQYNCASLIIPDFS